jgi:hypothetical protein
MFDERGTEDDRRATERRKPQCPRCGVGYDTDGDGDCPSCHSAGEVVPLTSASLTANSESGKVPPPPPKLLHRATDEELIAECQSRGLLDKRGIVTTLLHQRNQALKERDTALDKLRKLERK